MHTWNYKEEEDMKNFMKLLSSLLSPYSMAEIDPMVAYTMVEEGKAVIIDSRERGELSEGMIEGALWFPLSFTEVENWKNTFMPYLHNARKIFVYGNESGSAQRLTDILTANNMDAVNVGTFHSLEEILPLRYVHESSREFQQPMM